MAKSIKRVETAFRSFRLEVDIRYMPESARTAAEAAESLGCAVGQIVRSLIFETDTGKLALLLVSGKHTVDLKKFVVDWGMVLRRANPNQVRSGTGFAIGGVAPIGHLKIIDKWMDISLFDYEYVWAAAGAPNSVFSIKSENLLELNSATKFCPAYVKCT